MYLETRLNPQSRRTANRRSAAGLIQITESDLRKMGTTSGRMACMSHIEQLPIIERYLAPYQGQFYTLAETWLACYFPYGLGQKSNFQFRVPLKYANANRLFPVNAQGRTRIWEVEDALHSYFRRLGWG